MELCLVISCFCFSFAPVENELVFDSYRNHKGDGGDDSDSPAMDDDDDSNDENNWRNDYPDEEEGDNRSDLIQEIPVRLLCSLSKYCNFLQMFSLF